LQHNILLPIPYRTDFALANLLLVPTPAEAKFIRDSLGDVISDWNLQICGFGPIAAAARTGVLIARHFPEQVLLLGIAGSYDLEKCPVGSATQFSDVACYGVGIGSGDRYASATDIGWVSFDGDLVDAKIGDVITLACGYHGNKKSSRLLLTSPTASADHDDRRRRIRAFPEALAEDMEGYAVAAACLTASVPLCIIRGISNQVGERDMEHWDMGGAMEAAIEMAREMIESPQNR
jgi:futalosine hydrolase